jgi:hypothetical protein
MILRQHLHTEPVIAASYLFCAGHGAGAVVDPVGDPERNLEAAAAAGLRLRYVIDTHVHAITCRRPGSSRPRPAPNTSCTPRLRFSSRSAP